MTPPDQPLLVARTRAGLSIDEMALLVGVDAERLAAFERDDAYPPPEVVERCATVLGLGVRELLAGEEPTAVALLFRRMSHEGSSFVDAVDAGLAEALGGFVRTARETARLRMMLAEGPRADQLKWLEHFRPRPPARSREQIYAQVVEMAIEVRRFVGLSEDDEVVSMRELSERLGILTMFVDPDQLDRDIDGASLLSPQPAILVNLVGGGATYWRTRMTLAHELCHLLFDRAELDPAHSRKFFIFSPKRQPSRRRPAWHLFEHFEDLEARANAFAGEFLAPTSGVKKVVGSLLDKTSPEAVGRLIAHFKIGKETAVNRLKNTFRLSEEQRLKMLQRPTREGWAAAEHPDTVQGDAQLRDHVFVDLVMRAFARAKLDAIEARSLLGLRLSDALPEHEGLSAGQVAPLRQADDPVRSAAENHLRRCVGLEYFVRSVEQVGDGWRAWIARRGPDGRDVEVGHLLLGRDLSVSDDSAMTAAIA